MPGTHNRTPVALDTHAVEGQGLPYPRWRSTKAGGGRPSAYSGAVIDGAGTNPSITRGQAPIE